MAAPVLKTSDISLPVLQRTTSDRVSVAVNRGAFPLSDDDALPAPPPELLEYDGQDQVDGLNQPPVPYDDVDQPPPPPDLQQKQNPPQQQQQQLPDKMTQKQESETADRIQSKYAAPDNILPPQHQAPTNENSEEVNNITNDMKTQISISDNDRGLTVHSVAHLKERKGTGSVSAFSDTSSDVSDATTSAPSATSSNSVPVPVSIPEGATENDIQQVDMFYRSQKTDVRVCRSLANMYLSAAKTLDRMPAGQGSVSNGESPLKSPDPTKMSMDDWDFIKTGIPVLVLNTGEHIRSHKLSIILAEKGTGFSLWEDVLTFNTRYNTPHTNFHTMTLSTDHSRLVGFSFDEANSATEFADAVQSLLPKPDEDANDKKKKKKKEKKPKQKYKPPKKIDISQPCCFIHVTKLERPNVSLSLFPSPPSGAELSQAMLRSRSQSSELSESSTSHSEN